MLRIESLLLRLLKAVLIPITIRYLRLPVDSEALYSSDTGDPLRKESCRVLAAESSVSKFAMVLSKVLQEASSTPIRNNFLEAYLNHRKQKGDTYDHHILCIMVSI